MTRATGVDVSGYQPICDWGKVYDAGVRFVGIKSSEGASHVDSALRIHSNGFRQQPFLLGFYYHFLASQKPGEPAPDPVAQAKHFMDVVGSLRDHERLCLDVERHPFPDHPEKTLAWVDAFYTQLLGGTCNDRRPLIYTSARIWREMGDPAWSLASEIDLWTPRYSFDGSEPKLPKPWATVGWAIWQWTDGGATGPKHVTPGIGACDANFFRGDDAALAAFAKLAPLYTPPPLVA